MQQAYPTNHKATDTVRTVSHPLACSRRCAALATILGCAAVIVFPWDTEYSSILRFSPRLHGHHTLDGAIEWLHIFGKGDVLVLLALALGGWGFRRRSVSVLVALIMSTLLVWPLKLSVARERPRGHSLVSFPSGDTAAVTAAVVPCVVATPVILPAATVVVAGVAIGRVYHGAHYPSDVLAGMAVGLIAGGLALHVTRRIHYSWLRRRHFQYGLIIYLLALCTYIMATRPNPDIVKTMWLVTPLLCWRFFVYQQNISRVKALRSFVANLSLVVTAIIMLGVVV